MKTNIYNAEKCIIYNQVIETKRRNIVDYKSHIFHEPKAVVVVHPANEFQQLFLRAETLKILCVQFLSPTFEMKFA